MESGKVLGKKRRRLHLIKNTESERKYSSDLNHDSKVDDESEEKDSKDINSADEKKIYVKPEIIEIHSNYRTKEKFLLLLDNQNFTFFGKGIIRVIYGNIEMMGYEINSDNDKNEYEFDLQKNFILFKCKNTGKKLTKEDILQIKENYENILFCNNNQLGYNLDFSIINLEQFINRSISFIYFKNLSNDFKFLNLQNYDLNNKQFYNQNKKTRNRDEKNKIDKEKRIIESLEIIDTKKFSDSIELDLNTLKSNKKFNIFGKKNSGKSTFLVYFINSFLSSLNKNYSENCNLFFLECDSGQPLISCPYTVSLFKINKPIFMNFFRQSIYTQMDLARKINLALKDSNFNFSENFSKDLLEISNQISDLQNKEKVKQIESNEQLSDILNIAKSQKTIELIRSIFVDDNSPANNFEVYLNSVKSLYNVFNTINNFAMKRIENELKFQIKNQKHGFNINNINYIKDNLKNYLIINTNGYTSGVGNIVNSSINELIEPDHIYFIKNLKAGRLEKGEEFENLILNNEINYNNDVITRKFKLPEEEQKGILYNYKRFEKTTFLIENSFKLKEYENLNKKNFNRVYHITANLIGDYQFLEDESNIENFLWCEKNQIEDGLIHFNNKKIQNFYDILINPDYFSDCLTEISFDDLLISYDFSSFEPVNELDVLMSLNGKICSILSNENYNYKNNPLSIEKDQDFEKMEENVNRELSNIKSFSDFTIIDSRSLKEKIFKCFCYIFNIDIVNRKFIMFSKQLKEEKILFDYIKINEKKKDSLKNIEEIEKKIKKNIEFILLRNSNLDKNLYDSIFLKENKHSKVFHSQPFQVNPKTMDKGNLFFENILIMNKFDFKNLKYYNIDQNEVENHNQQNNLTQKKINSQNSYMTRNKYNLI